MNTYEMTVVGKIWFVYNTEPENLETHDDYYTIFSDKHDDDCEGFVGYIHNSCIMKTTDNFSYINGITAVVFSIPDDWFWNHGRYFGPTNQKDIVNVENRTLTIWVDPEKDLFSNSDENNILSQCQVGETYQLAFLNQHWLVINNEL